MKVESNSKEFYCFNIVNKLTGLEEERKFLVKQILKEQILPIILATSIAFILILLSNVSRIVWIGFCSLVFFYCWWFYSVILKQRIKQFKTSVVEDLDQFFDCNLIYKPEEKIAKKSLLNSQIIDGEIDSYDGGEYLAGKIGSAKFKSSKIKIKKETRAKLNNTNWEVLFEGLVFVIDFKQEFTTEIIVKTDITERVFENLKGSMQKTVGLTESPLPEGKLVKVDDPRLARKFKIWAKEKKSASLFLQSEIKKKIWQLEREVSRLETMLPFLVENKITQKELCLSFIGSKLYITVPFTGGKIFTPDLFSKYRSKFKYLRYYFDLLRQVVELIEEIRQNREEKRAEQRISNNSKAAKTT